MDISQIITQNFAGPVSKQIAARLGVSEGTANLAIQLAVPLLLRALARNASQRQGAQDLHQAVANDHDGSILDNLMGHLEDPGAANGTGILGHVFGSQRDTAESNLAQATGLDQRSAADLMEIVAPVVMGTLGRTQQQAGFDSPGLANYLEQQQQQAAAAPGMMGMLNSLLDSNRDGSVADDLSRIAGNLFK